MRNEPREFRISNCGCSNAKNCTIGLNFEWKQYFYSYCKCDRKQRNTKGKRSVVELQLNNFAGTDDDREWSKQWTNNKLTFISILFNPSSKSKLTVLFKINNNIIIPLLTFISFYLVLVAKRNNSLNLSTQSRKVLFKNMIFN